MRRPGNLRGIGKLGHYNLGQAPSFNPINRANPFGPGNPMPTTAYETSVGYSINNPNASSAPSTPPPVSVIPTPAVTAPPVVTPTPTPAPVITTPIPVVQTPPASSSSNSSNSNNANNSSNGSSSSSSGSSNGSSSGSSNAVSAGTTASVYTIPIPGYHYPLPGVQNLPDLTTSYTSANTVNTNYNSSNMPASNLPIWNKPKVKFLALALIVALALKE